MNLKRRWFELFPGLAYRVSARRLKSQSTETVFGEILKKKAWGSEESVSGPGSELDQTRNLIVQLPPLFRQLEIQSILDIPCGDFHWMKNVDLGEIEYIGADLLNELISENTKNHRREHISFRTLNLIQDPLPQVDLILCRDCLVHFSPEDVFIALANICKSQSKYLLTTTFTNRKKNRKIATGQWHPLHLQAPPFHFPTPLFVLNEGCTENGGIYGDKSLALWKIPDLRASLG